MLSASVNRVSAHGLEHASATSAPVSVRQQLHVPLRPLGSLLARSSLVAEPAQQEQESTNAATSTPLGAGSPHPDALARRIAAEKRAARRDTERQKAAEDERQGVPWWEVSMPPNMINCTSTAQYKALVAQAAKDNKLLVAKFFTSDCYVCKSLYPKIRSIAAQHPDVQWVKLNGSDPVLVDLFRAMGVTKVPLMHLVVDGQLVSELSCSLSSEKLAIFRAELQLHKPKPVQAPEAG